MSFLPVGLQNLINSIETKIWKYILIGLFILLGMFLFWVFYTYEYDNGIKKKENITISLNTKKNISIFKDVELKLHNQKCSRINENKLEFECNKPKNGKYRIEINNYIDNIEIIDNIYTYSIKSIDKEDSLIKEASLKLKDNKFEGKLLVVKKDNNIPKYVDTNKKFNLKIYNSNFQASIENTEILFSKPWKDFFNVYYLNNKLFVDYEIDNEKFYSYKPYFLTKELDVDDLFSFGQNNENIIIKDVLKIKDNNLEVLNYSKKLPNINLFKVQTDENKNGYIKFTIKNINKDNIFNLYMNTRHVFKYEYPNFKFDIREVRDSDNFTERIIIGPESFIQDSIAPNEKEAKFEKGIIKNLYFLFEKKDNNCKLTVNADKYKKVTKEFLCKDDSLNESINSQLHIENSKCTNNNDKKCVLFEISDFETGLDFSSSPTRNYSY
ncbi:hypothetical protein B0174_07255 [Arcobacter caeni]|uniref:Uncharacterized protein n=1 Tax=Arcobacter caeni TaxID=1912877 RepID=A0A363CYQ3_9BACT|nr:hypothetical protein B0174_07255 [Arcobacter caeni]